MAFQKITQKQMTQHINWELTRRMQNGDDINSMLQLSLHSCNAAEQWLILSHKVHARELNILGTMHGGLISWIMDSSMGILCRSCTGDLITPTIDIHINYLHAIHQDDEIHSRASILHIGRYTVTMETVIDVSGQKCATASATFYRAKKATES